MGEDEAGTHEALGLPAFAREPCGNLSAFRRAELLNGIFDFKDCAHAFFHSRSLIQLRPASIFIFSYSGFNPVKIYRIVFGAATFIVSGDFSHMHTACKPQTQKAHRNR